MADRVLIFDTTLRDGEQSPGVSYNVADKLEIATQLEKLNVDYLEAGFPASSPGDLAAVAAIARQIRGCAIVGLARANKKDIDACWEAVQHAAHPRIHVFLSSSDIHMLHQLHKDREEVLEMARSMVAYAKKFTDDIEFSPMDATRSERAYVYRMLKECIDAGATTVNIPDTVGYAIPSEFHEFIRGVQANVPNIDRATISVHCHNDLGLSTANSLAAVRAGARQIECTINGVGERGGNAALEEVVMAMRTRSDFFAIDSRIKTREIYRTSRLVSDLSGMTVQPNKAIVGANAFRHQSGIHQDGILKMRETYEIMDAKEIGWPSGGAEMVLGKLSGRHGFKARLEQLGYDLNEEELGMAFLAFKELADKKTEIDDRDLEALVADKLRTNQEVYHLDHVQVTAGDHITPTATVRLIAPDGTILQDAALGSGPVDAVCKAINRIIQVDSRLTEFSVKSVTEGIDAQGEVTIRVEKDGHTYVGRGADTDILVASARAYMNAINRLLSASQPAADTQVRRNP
ncbi:MAG: 2-isopropylmalate synthase [Dehalococcoidia bacterium]|nr:2-isopropylmalate synthase [Dehalococcoidia bacterium]